MRAGPSVKVRSSGCRRTKPACSSDTRTACPEAWLSPTDRVISDILKERSGSPDRNNRIRVARSTEGEVRLPAARAVRSVRAVCAVCMATS